MSHSFYVHNVGNLSYDNTLNSLGIKNLQLTGDSPQPENNVWPEGDAYLYIDQQSVRPIETSYNGDTFSARIFANSSPDDYELAIKLIAEIARKNGAEVEPEDNDAMDVERFLAQYDINWIKEHCTSMLQILVASYQKEKGILTMSGTVRSLEAGPRFFGQLLADPKNAFNEFHKRFRTLNYLETQDCYIANGIRLRNEAGDLEVVTSVYGPEVPTIITENADAITIRSDGEEHYYVTIDQLADALGNKSSWLSETILFTPAIEGDDWSGLLESLRPVAKTDVFEFARPVEESDLDESVGYKSKFSNEEWQYILYSPIVTFALIASADGSIDRKEVESFQQQLIHGLAEDNAMMQQLMIEVIPNIESLTREVLEGNVDPKSIIENVAAAVDSKLSSEDALQFKLSLLQIGKAVAESSGGFLGVFGSKVSKEENQALAALTVLLKIAPLH